MSGVIRRKTVTGMGAAWPSLSRPGGEPAYPGGVGAAPEE